MIRVKRMIETIILFLLSNFIVSFLTEFEKKLLVLREIVHKLLVSSKISMKLYVQNKILTVFRIKIHFFEISYGLATYKNNFKSEIKQS